MGLLLNNNKMHISLCGLQDRTLNSLLNGGVETVEDLEKVPMRELTQFRGFGQKAKAEVEGLLKDFNKYSLADSIHLNSSLEDILRLGSHLEGSKYLYLRNSILSNNVGHRETQWQFGLPLSRQAKKTKEIILYIFNSK